MHFEREEGSEGALFAQNRERLPECVSPLSWDLLVGSSALGTSAIPQMEWASLLPLLLAVVPEELQTTLLLPLGSACPFGGVLSQPCLQGEHWQRTGKGGTHLSQGCTLSPALGMVPRGCASHSEGTRWGSALPLLLLLTRWGLFLWGVWWAARCLELGSCLSSLLASEALLTQEGSKRVCRVGKGAEVLLQAPAARVFPLLAPGRMHRGDNTR